MAKSARSAKSEGGGGGSLIWVQGLACGGMAALAPMPVLQIVVLLAPGLLSLLMERRDGKPVTRVMLLFGLAASVEPVRQAWAAGIGPGWDRITDPQAVLFAWAAAAAGWLMARVVPLVVRAIVDASHAARAERLRTQREGLVRDWGLEDGSNGASVAEAQAGFNPTPSDARASQ